MSQPPLGITLGLAVASILLFADANLAKLPTLSAKIRLAQKGKKKSKSSAPEESGRPVLWEDRGDPSKLNLSLGVGSEEGQPNPPFKFDKEDLSGRLKLHYRGRSQSLFRSVPVEHAKWFAGIVGQLTDDQLRDAFRAGEATPREVEGFTRRLRQKINQLKEAVGM